MKTLILSDIHANIYALEAIWSRETGCDLILCAGDLVDYGPFPREVLGWVRSHNVRCVQGNHDAWVAFNYRQGRIDQTVPETERAWAHYNAGLLNEEEIQFLEGLPRSLTISLDGIVYGMAHMFRDYNEIVSMHAFTYFCEEIAGLSAPGAAPEAITRLILGHTHRQAVRYLADDRLWLNPGSVSYRRADDPDQSAHYATITDEKISLKRLEYDRSSLYRFVQGVKLKDSEMQVALSFFEAR